MKREQLAREELERRHLSIVLQVQHLLQGLQQEHVRRDLLGGNNQAPHLPAQKLRSLNQLATVLGAERDPRLRYCCSAIADEPLGQLEVEIHWLVVWAASFALKTECIEMQFITDGKICIF